jgi:hypothetical protein
LQITAFAILYLGFLFFFQKRVGKKVQVISQSAGYFGPDSCFGTYKIKP